VPLNRIALPGERNRADELYSHLRAAILSGELRPRERLVENAVARLALVSRTPVREALHRLEVDGLVRESDGGGMEVCGFSLEELGDLCAVRETLEGMATNLAATSRSEMDIAMLRRVLDAELATDHDAPSRVALNHAFHETLWRASRNRYLTTQLQGLREVIEVLQPTTLSYPLRRREALTEHGAIVDAVERQDSAEAERLARVHFRNAMAARMLMSDAHQLEPPISA
jgi:DNA-binding GntR family transcriptional regulator